MFWYCFWLRQFASSRGASLFLHQVFTPHRSPIKFIFCFSRGFLGFCPFCFCFFVFFGGEGVLGLVCWAVGWWMVGWLDGWVVGWLGGWVVGWLVGGWWLVGCQPPPSKKSTHKHTKHKTWDTRGKPPPRSDRGAVIAVIAASCRWPGSCCRATPRCRRRARRKALGTQGCENWEKWVWLSKPMGSHFGIGEFSTHFRTYLVGIGMFTGGRGCEKLGVGQNYTRGPTTFSPGSLIYQGSSLGTRF